MPEGRECGCGRLGCLETYVSSRGLCRTVFELLASRLIDSELRRISFNDLTAEKVFQSACRSDAIALAAFEFTGKILGRALADMAAYFSPEAIIIYGGLTKAGDLLFKPTRRHFDENLLDIFKGKIKILQSKVSTGSAAVLGASALIRQEIAKCSNGVKSAESVARGA